WRDAEPFPHVIVDGFVHAERLPGVLAVLEEEEVSAFAGEIYAFDATLPVPRTEGLRQLRDAFAAALAPVLSRVTGKALARADMRAYAYRPGHYLLPHTDH